MDRRVQIVIAMMKDDLCREWSLDSLARSLGMSRSRFQHLFKAETGSSPAHYLRALRLEHARELLESSLLNVKQVMTNVGIYDKSHFGRAFKKAYGLTPTQYRVAHPPAIRVKSDRDRHAT